MLTFSIKNVSKLQLTKLASDRKNTKALMAVASFKGIFHVKKLKTIVELHLIHLEVL